MLHFIKEAFLSKQRFTSETDPSMIMKLRHMNGSSQTFYKCHDCEC